VSVSAATRYRLDDLRRLAASLASALGVSPPRASALASQLLWFDAAGRPEHGIATLPDWLDRIDRKEVDPLAEGRPRLERAGTAAVDGQNGLAPLVLAKAAGIAAEKARDVGLGVVRVTGLGPSGPAAPVAAELAIGPFMAAIVGPGPSWTLAVPTAEGLPAIHDSALGSSSGPAEIPGGLDSWAPWAGALAGGEGGWAILAIAVLAFEPLADFRERIAAMAGSATPWPASLSPVAWEASRREARERGVALDDRASAGLRDWAGRLGVAWPSETEPNA